MRLLETASRATPETLLQSLDQPHAVSEALRQHTAKHDVRGGLAGLEEDAVAGADGLDRAATPLAEATAFGDGDRLPERGGCAGLSARRK